MQFIEEISRVIGLENEEALDAQPDLSLNLVVLSKTSSSSPPEVISVSVDIIEEGDSLLWDFTPWGGAST